MGSIFTGTYLLYKDVPKETMSERSVPKRTKLKSQRFNEIERKKKNGNKELFKIHFTDYQNPSSMYKKWSEAENAEINKDRVDLIKEVLTKLKKYHWKYTQRWCS